MKLAVIPARGGSKRIPRKNIKLFGGKPMIGWSLRLHIVLDYLTALLLVRITKKLFVAREHGVEVPFMRPAELSDDYQHSPQSSRML